VGYRVKSLRGTQFRIWATERLREYLIKGFTMNDELLKQGGGYFEELLDRIRDIRSSEKKYFTARCWKSTPRAWITTHERELLRKSNGKKMNVKQTNTTYNPKAPYQFVA
jgi:hypothetical protein